MSKKTKITKDISDNPSSAPDNDGNNDMDVIIHDTTVSSSVSTAFISATPNNLVLNNSSNSSSPLYSSSPPSSSSVSESRSNQRQVFLIQTMGAIGINEERGDGAYAKWMERYFESNQHSKGLKHATVELTGGSNVDSQLVQDELNEAIGPFLEQAGANPGDLIIFNWHIRFTGRPNSWTGRGLHEAEPVIDQLREQGNYDIKIVLTIHESENLKPIIYPSPMKVLEKSLEIGYKCSYDKISTAQ